MTDKINILLIEDNPGDARLISAYLDEVAYGHYNLVAANDLTSGMKRLSENKFDIILLDLGLPDSQGLDTLKRLETIETPIIILTGLNDEAVALATAQEGAQDYLIKGTFDGPLLWRSIRYTIERRNIFARLKHSEAEKLAILESISELVTHQDTNLKILWTNRFAAESVGMTPEKLIGLHCYEVWPHRSQPCPGCPVKKAIKTGQPQNAEMTTPDGRIWFIRGYPLKDKSGNVNGAVEVTLEITGRKKAELELNLRAELLDSAGDAIFLHTLDGKFTYVNAAVCTSLGYTKDELLSLNLSEIAAPGIQIEDHNKKILNKGQAVFESAQLRKDGSVMPVEVKSRIIEIENTKFVLSIVRDITERKQAEKEIKEREALLNMVGDIGVIGGWEMDLINRKAKWTKTLYDILEIGYDNPVPGISAAGCSRCAHHQDSRFQGPGKFRSGRGTIPGGALFRSDRPAECLHPWSSRSERGGEYDR